MYKFLTRKGPTIAFLLAVVCIAITIIPIISGLDAFNLVPEEKNQHSFSEEGNIFYVGIYMAGILLGFAILATILGSLFGVATNPKAAIKGIISMVVLLVVFGVLYAMSDGAATGSLAETIGKFEVSENISKVISAGISLTLIMGLGSVVIIVAMEIMNFVKNQ